MTLNLTSVCTEKLPTLRWIVTALVIGQLRTSKTIFHQPFLAWIFALSYKKSLSPISSRHGGVRNRVGNSSGSVIIRVCHFHYCHYFYLMAIRNALLRYVSTRAHHTYKLNRTSKSLEPVSRPATAVWHTTWHMKWHMTSPTYYVSTGTTTKSEPLDDASNVHSNYL